MRKFSFENKYGERFSFQEYENSLSYSIEGLGFSLDSSYSKVGEYFVANKRSLSQKVINFSCLFKDSETYHNFLKFSSNDHKLKLVYFVDDREYFLDIHVSRINKIDKLRNKVIVCMIDLVNTSLFYERLETRYELNYGANPNRFDFQWGVDFKDEIDGVIEFEVRGNTPSAFLLEIYGEAVKPKVQFIDADNNMNEMEFDITVNLGERILYSTVDSDLFVVLEKVDGSIENIFHCLDFKKNNFKKLNIGYNQIIVTNINRANITVFDSYVTI